MKTFFELVEGINQLMRAKKSGKLPVKKAQNFIRRNLKRIDKINSNPDVGLNSNAAKLRNDIIDLVQ